MPPIYTLRSKLEPGRVNDHGHLCYKLSIYNAEVLYQELGIWKWNILCPNICLISYQKNQKIDLHFVIQKSLIEN